MCIRRVELCICKSGGVKIKIRKDNIFIILSFFVAAGVFLVYNVFLKKGGLSVEPKKS